VKFEVRGGHLKLLAGIGFVLAEAESALFSYNPFSEQQLA